MILVSVVLGIGTYGARLVTAGAFFYGESHLRGVGRLFG